MSSTRNPNDQAPRYQGNLKSQLPNFGFDTWYFSGILGSGHWDLPGRGM